MAESYLGRVSNGVVILEGATALADGTTVRVEPIAPPVVAPKPPDPVAGTRRMLLAWGSRAESVAPPLPSDLAEEHGHYAHGKPRP
jgi:hypothetical protein